MPTTRLSTTAAAIASERMTGEQRGGRQQQIGAEHHQLAMRQIEHAADAVDQHIAARDQRIDRSQHDDVDDELHAAILRTPRGQGKPPRESSCRRVRRFRLYFTS